MLDVLFNQKATVRRAKTRDARNKIVYEEVKTEAGIPIPIRCRLSGNGRRVTDKEGTQITADATAIFKVSDAITVDIADMLMIDGVLFKIVGLSSEKVIGAGVSYMRADLSLNVQPVEGDDDAS